MQNEVKFTEEKISEQIYVIRGIKVMLDRELAEMYSVKAISLRKQVNETSADSLSILCFNCQMRKRII
jgi:maleate cis-trans isomerase